MKTKIIIAIIVLTIASIGIGSYIKELNEERKSVIVQGALWMVLLNSMTEESRASYLAEASKLLSNKEE